MTVLDTCALLWWTLDPEQLSPRARQVIDETAPQLLLVSSVSLWEIGWKQRLGKIQLPGSLTEYTRRLESLNRLTLLPVDAALWIRVAEMEWAHRDPADRIIVATAESRNATLLTSDDRILTHYSKAVW